MNFNQIKRYLEGKTSENESEQIRSWLKDPANTDESRMILGNVWTNSELMFNGSVPDFDQMLNQIHQQISSTPEHRHLPESKSGAIKRIIQLFSKVAAILFLPLLLLSVYLYFNLQQNSFLLASNSDKVREIYTKPGTRTKIELPDGTNVWLNDGTILRYPENFSGPTRDVYVDGEAYFEVTPNPKKPFVVDNPMMRTVVTGTHFNLNSYSDDHFFEATLLEGKIHLEKGTQNLSVNPGEQVQFDALNQKILQKNVIAENAAAWIDGKLVFKDEKLETAIKKIGRWYNVEIILTDPELSGYLLTATVSDEKLDQTLNLISLALPVTFKFKKETNQTEIQRTIYVMKK